MANKTIHDLSEVTKALSTHQLEVDDGNSATSTEKMPLSMLGLELDTTYDSASAHSNITGVIGEMQMVDVSALSAGITWTTPASAKLGEMCGIYISNGSTTAGEEVGIRTPATDEIQGTNYNSADFTRVWQEGEVLVFQCISATNPDWRLAYDGRIACVCKITPGSATTGESSNTWTDIDLSGGTAHTDIGGMANIANDRVDVRRSGDYVIQQAGRPNSSVADQKFWSLGYSVNADVNTEQVTIINPSTGTSFYANASFLAHGLVSGDTITPRYRTQEGSRGWSSSLTITWLIVREVL